MTTLSLEMLSTSVLGRKLIAEADATELVAAQAVAKKLRQLNLEDERSGATRGKALVDAREAYEAAERHARDLVDAAKVAYRDVRDHARTVSREFDTERAALESTLRKRSIPEIDALVAELHELQETARHYGPRSHIVETAWSRGPAKIISNQASFARHVAALGAAIVAADALRLEALGPADLTKALTALRASIPVVEEPA
jgi:hypothetical protein